MPVDGPFSARTDSEIVSRIIQEAAEGNSAVLAPSVSLMVEIGELGEDVLGELRKSIDELLGKNSSDLPEPARHALLEVATEVYGIQQDVARFISAAKNIAASNARICPTAE